MKEFIAKRIVIKGLVQGIGYRPFVAELAEEYQITGWVRNTAGIVTVMAWGNAGQMEQFLSALKEKKPMGAQIASIEIEEAGDREETDSAGFRIVESEENAGETVIPFIPPDLPTCQVCEKQLFTPSDRRYRYPFISCVSCGPRYSIIERLPYDRDTITMRDFTMCDSCGSEYVKKGDIRRHAQTIACESCGPKLSYIEVTAPGELVMPKMCEQENFAEHMTLSESALMQAVDCLKSGGIVAIKDIGGFHLACSPYDEAAVAALRLIKGRERKPFAVMFSYVELVRQYCEADAREEAELLSDARPIVLLKKRETDAEALAENVCMGSPDIGAMVPCNPLQILLLEEMKALVMTSANRSGELMITENDRMEAWMQESGQIMENAGIRLGVLAHDRRILTPLDDSIVRVTAGYRQIFRRARGMVPMPVNMPFGRVEGQKCKREKDKVLPGQIFASGGDLKACFCYLNGNQAYLSQHFGDLEDEESLLMYQKEAERMKGLFGFEPKQFATDLHPAYLSVQMVNRMPEASGNGQSMIQIQHHHAHGASVIAEHGLKGKVLCATFDGTGYGLDKTVWGSEFFLWDGSRMERMAHLTPVCLPGGNEGAKNADGILYGYLASFQEELEERLQQLPWLNMGHYKLVRTAMRQKLNSVTSSSMGRLFDAVSALLDICHYNGYEGEAPIELEYLAAKTNRSYPLRIELEWDETKNCYLGTTETLFEGILSALESSVPKEEIARGFILAVADWVCLVCDLLGEQIWKDSEKRQITLSGGTFQNRILLEETVNGLKKRGFLVYLNEQVPPGDGGICLGQAYLASIELETGRN